MTGYSPYAFAFKPFVKEGGYSEAAEDTIKTVPVAAKPMSGDAAKEFYESIINETPSFESSKLSVKRLVREPLKRDKSDPKKRKRFSKNDLLKFAQNNDALAIKTLLDEDRNISVDSTDEFGWTALMCASCNGAQEAVQVLMKYGANVGHCDKFGNNAKTLAKRKKFFHILDILEGVHSSRQNQNKKKFRITKPFFCAQCNETFVDGHKIHETSTLHLLNNDEQKFRTFYGIPDSNKGFQMLLKEGWNREKGLGPEESGIQFPIKVTKKNDRIGFGGSYFAKEIQLTAENITCDNSGLNNTEILEQKKKEKQFERNFRLQFA